MKIEFKKQQESSFVKRNFIKFASICLSIFTISFIFYCFVIFYEVYYVTSIDSLRIPWRQTVKSVVVDQNETDIETSSSIVASSLALPVLIKGILNTTSTVVAALSLTNSNNQTTTKERISKLENATTMLQSSNINQERKLLNVKLHSVKSTPRIFCMILSTNSSLEKKAKAVNQTWAKDCDKYFFIAKITNASNISQEFYDPLPVLQPSNFVQDQYRLLTEKVYRTFVDVHAKYNDYDWYLKADDDTYMFMDNLRSFLKDKDQFKPVTYGHDFKLIVKNGYHSGGAGYVMSNEAFNRIGSALTNNFTFCPNTGTEDVNIAQCLRNLNVYPEKSIDEMGKERFHPLDVDSYFKGRFPEWLYSYSSNPVKKGKDCCAESTISFHYMSPDEIKKMHSMYEKLKKNLNNSTITLTNTSKNSTNSTSILPFASLLYQFSL